MKLSSLSVTLLASLADVQGAAPFRDDKKKKKGMKQEGQALLDSGNDILCKTRGAFSFNKFSTFFPRPDDEPAPLAPLLEEVSLEVNVLGDGLYSAVFTRTVDCSTVGIKDDCPDSPVDTETLVKYYFVGSQSYVPSKKNEISFASHYAEYQVNVNGDFAPLEEVGDWPSKSPPPCHPPAHRCRRRHICPRSPLPTPSHPPVSAADTFTSASSPLLTSPCVQSALSEGSTLPWQWCDAATGF